MHVVLAMLSFGKGSGNFINVIVGIRDAIRVTVNVWSSCDWVGGGRMVNGVDRMVAGMMGNDFIVTDTLVAIVGLIESSE